MDVRARMAAANLLRLQGSSSIPPECGDRWPEYRKAWKSMTDTAGLQSPPAAIDARRLNALQTGMICALWAELRADAPAIVSAKGNRTFAELNARANQLVRALRARGLQPGDAVALMCSNRPEFAEVLVATRRSGLRFTPINRHLTG